MTLIDYPVTPPLSMTNAASTDLMTPTGIYSSYREETGALSPATMVVDHASHATATSRDMPAAVCPQLREEPATPAQTIILRDCAAPASSCSASNVAASCATPGVLCTSVAEPDKIQTSACAVCDAANAPSNKSIPQRDIEPPPQHPLVGRNSTSETTSTEPMPLPQYIQVNVPWDECENNAQLKTVNQLDDCRPSDKHYFPAGGDGRVASDIVTTRDESMNTMPKKLLPSGVANQIAVVEESECSSVRSPSPFSKKRLRAVLHSVSNLFFRKKDDSVSAESQYPPDRPTTLKVLDQADVLIMSIGHKDSIEEQCYASHAIPSTAPQLQADVSTVAPLGDKDSCTKIQCTAPQTCVQSHQQPRQQESSSSPPVPALDAFESRVTRVAEMAKKSCDKEAVDQARIAEAVEEARALVACVLAKVLKTPKVVASITHLPCNTNLLVENTAPLRSALLQTSTRSEQPVALQQAPILCATAELNVPSNNIKAVPDVRPARSADAGVSNVESRLKGSAEGGGGTVATSTGSSRGRHQATSDTTDATSEVLGAFLHSINAHAASSKDPGMRENPWYIVGGTAASSEPAGKTVPPVNIACAPSTCVYSHYAPIAHGSNNGFVLPANFVVSPQFDASRAASDCREHGHAVYAAVSAHGITPPNAAANSPVLGYVATSTAAGNGAFSFYAPTAPSYLLAMPTDSRIYPLVLQQLNTATEESAVHHGTDKKTVDTKAPPEYNLEHNTLFNRDDRNLAPAAWFHAIPIARSESTIADQPHPHLSLAARPPTSRQTKHRVPQAKHKYAPDRSKQTLTTATYCDGETHKVTPRSTIVRTATTPFACAYDVPLSSAPRKQRPSSAPRGNTMINGTIPGWLVKRREINRSSAMRNGEELANSWQKPWGANTKCYDTISSRFLSGSLLRGKFQFKPGAMMDAPSRATACLLRTQQPASPTRVPLPAHQTDEAQPHSSSPTRNPLVVHQPLNQRVENSTTVESQDNLHPPANASRVGNIAPGSQPALNQPEAESVHAPIVQKETLRALVPLPQSSTACAASSPDINGLSPPTFVWTRHEPRAPIAPKHSAPEAAVDTARSTPSAKPMLEYRAGAMDAQTVEPSTAGAGNVLYETLVQQQLPDTTVPLLEEKTLFTSELPTFADAAACSTSQPTPGEQPATAGTLSRCAAGTVLMQQIMANAPCGPRGGQEVGNAPT
eukprot:GEMP01000702.1.p1 GENE.GEMP01000702.1~~GEMP01000702.1.p1  ORF type:complete len:1198 (+),score=250.72 GEMP01000702.1:1674-5267(+)